MKAAHKGFNNGVVRFRLSDLRNGAPTAARREMVNLKVPADVLSRVHEVARHLGVTKTAAIVALFNEGLDAAQRVGLRAARSQ